ncbi:MarR family winged helix-turn-helix transcriptional regulator [Thioclava sp. GXIMD2076]|uniref:MarR family winged helix-turn-helix transcriptional regulator n=1 Tax=unclassified Thioclava TaxID=2621713 RepID=UPI0030D37EC4
MPSEKPTVKPIAGHNFTPVAVDLYDRTDRPLTVSRPELLINGSDAEFRKLIHAFFGFLSRHEKVRANFGANIGLGGVEYSVLVAISHMTADDGFVIVSQLAEHLHLSSAFVTTVTKRLEKMGLVEKTVDPEDRRKIQLTITETAYGLLCTLAPIQQKVNDVEFGTLRRGDLSFMVNMMESLIEGAERALKLQDYLRSNPDHIQPEPSKDA